MLSILSILCKLHFLCGFIQWGSWLKAIGGALFFMKKILIFILIAGMGLYLLSLLSSCSKHTDITNIPNDSTGKDTTGTIRDTLITLPLHINLGLPKDNDSSDDYIISRDQYTLSYNPLLNVANWVSWNENASWYGSEPRCDCMQPDPMLPKNFVPVYTSDYTNSGYDRGHILGSEARTRNPEDNKSTFYMTNIYPQTPDLNRETWASMERFQDSLSTKAGKELFVIAGGIYKTRNRIKNKITIPDSCWKIIVVLESGQRLKDVNASTPVYASIMANGNYTLENNDWRLYRTTVRRIEQSTGYNLLSAVPKAVQEIIENR
jgi:endonuclease G